MRCVSSDRSFRHWPAIIAIAVAVALLVMTTGAAQAAGVAPATAKTTAEQLDQTVSRALEYLAKNQEADGAFSRHSGVGVTALVTTAMLRHRRTPADPMVARSLQYLEKAVQPDGGIYTAKMGYGNYETCIAILCFSEANADKHYDKLIKTAEKYVKATQWGETTGKERSDLFYGGAGYGREKRPDLSNTAFLVDALARCGNGPDDEAIQKALIFVSRCQNLESEHNTTPFPAKNPDGGFYYTPANGGNSAAGKTAEGGLRSYGAMTYSGLKSMIYAGLRADDPRVKAAKQWIRQNYDLKANPGLGGDGLYYYYTVFAKTLAVMGVEQFEDAKGGKHDWRAELIAELTRRQAANGSWNNPQSRWLEGDPNLVTGYALLALSYCRPAAAK